MIQYLLLSFLVAVEFICIVMSVVLIYAYQECNLLDVNLYLGVICVYCYRAHCCIFMHNLTGTEYVVRCCWYPMKLCKSHESLWSLWKWYRWCWWCVVNSVLKDNSQFALMLHSVTLHADCFAHRLWWHSSMVMCCCLCCVCYCVSSLPSVHMKPHHRGTVWEGHHNGKHGKINYQGFPRVFQCHHDTLYLHASHDYQLYRRMIVLEAETDHHRLHTTVTKLCLTNRVHMWQIMVFYGT